jgi:hypothetical protein
MRPERKGPTGLLYRPDGAHGWNRAGAPTPKNHAHLGVDKISLFL